MLLSAALIVRDEERFLAGCLESIRDVVDEVVVVDTGSIDATPEIAQAFGARLLHHRWQDDFAAARNVALDAAAGAWILYIDADERLTGADRAAAEQLLVGAEHVAFRLKLQPTLGTTPYREYRLWRHDPRIRFVGRIHEKVTPAIGAVAEAEGRPIGDCDFLLTHLGYEGPQEHKHRRNLPLLRAEIERDPSQLFNWHQLARVLIGLGRDEEGIGVLLEAVERARAAPWDPVGPLVFADMIGFRRWQGAPFEELLAEALSLYPDDKQLWWIEAQAHMAAGRHRDALPVLDRLLAVDLDRIHEDGPAYDQRFFGDLAHDAYGTCLFRLGDYAGAAAAYGRAAACEPESIVYRSKREVALGRAGRRPR